MDKQRNGCLLRLLGALIGSVLGAVVAVSAGDWIGSALGISTFEGERGFFIAFVLLPLFGIAGGVLGALLARRRG
jgi:hypothetical protein